MKLFNRQGVGRTLLLAAAMIWAAFISGAFAQTDTASVPFKVNVNATVSATNGVTQRQITVTANQETLLRLPLQNTDGVRFFGTQRQTNVPTIISNRSGKVVLNLPVQTYKNAEISIYTVNGKRISRSNTSASSAANNILRLNIATGVYLLSIRGTDGNALTFRLTHNGGGLDISVVFSGENSPSASRLAKKAETGDWTITVAAPEYVSFVYTLRPVAGTNPLQNITLQKVSSGGGDSSYEYVEIGDLMWMKKNLNVETADSWCYGNSPDSCAKYGRLYTWAAAKTTCKSVGMRLPTRADWDALVTAAGSASTAGKTLKSTSGWYDNRNGTDEFGFSALPGGFWRYDGYFNGAGNYGYWWTATEIDVSNAVYHRMEHNSNNVSRSYGPKSNGQSVRCVEDVSDEYVEIDGLKWMKKNLNIETTDSWCYGNSADSCAKYGRLYAWAAAKKACQSIGWRLPSRNDWDQLAQSVGGSKSSSYGMYHYWLDAGKKLKSKSGWYNNGNGTDDFGFSALPGGTRYTDGDFVDAGYRGYWWTVTENGDYDAYGRYMYDNADDVSELYYFKINYFSVRCVKD